MTLEKFPISFSTRLKQFFCKHETIGKTAFTQGINDREGYDFVIYECAKCRHCIARWEKKEDW